MSYILPSEVQMQAFQSAFSESEQVTMLNMIKFRETADYTGLPDEPACSGAEAYARYEKHVIPILTACGASIIFSEMSKTTVIGPEQEQWDKVILVTYPNAPTMGQMLMSTEYQAIAHHRTAATADSRLIATTSP